MLSKVSTFKTVLENLSDGISIIDKEGKHVWINKAMATITGFTKEELLKSSPPHIYWPEEELDTIMKALGETMEGKFRNFELIFVRKSGVRFPVLVNPSPIENDEGEVQYFVATVKDLTEVRRVQHELDDLAYNYRVLHDNTSELICRHELDGRYKSVSPSSIRITGYRPDELIGRDPYEFIKEDHLEQVRQNLHEQALAGNDLIRTQYEAKRKDGTIIWLDTITKTLLDENQKPTELVTISREITELKSLQTKLEENNRELKRSNMELENFAYIASHDLKEPLRTIDNYVQLFEMRYSHVLDDKARQYFEFIKSSAKHSIQLTEDLLNYSRLNSSEFPYKEVDMNEVLENVCSQLQSRIAKSQAKLVYDKNMPSLVGSHILLSRLFINLIANSIKFKSEEKPLIRIAVKETINAWQFSVSDNGVGIPKKSRKEVFEIFRRLRTTDDEKGSGMGLTICKRIVEKHQGEIWIEANEPKGSTFKFTISKHLKESTNV
ncbi:PAS domain-containing sensor histidine kinase [Roseivirga thermotolerans]|uniref:histidine kinase n=1 Tax=Roseivirga thermotolerans TaxID=1758176 RepID=A0ABQ3IBP7_9BACT|nr:PAS domain-containing sensor histidine kinase [Roseivirga thermotolerans]GHE72534.1 hypothetical protein GCM10011340_31110 [Roseivirga thermotolerans]